ncbi:glycogen debranching protein GlgX [Vibrio sp. SM6]|uniref:Glycogen debranching protein GlgX n=1 Tax=Vibrio agarilyticus TaxID=2726741 RepID=A0A7X8YG31_9VIBR|nr:glycogen debranching protein GlgX [Vibrio agarilyticus]NLS11981.1 glycogen debranching protein GlgX [Vibrio agarilyticus]
MNTVISSPYPLGATLDERGCNFSVHAPDARDVCLALFNDKNEFKTFKLDNFYGGIRHTYVEGVQEGQRYGYIAYTDKGPILLSDPYAKALDGPLTYTPPFQFETSFLMAKSVVRSGEFDWQGVKKPNIPREETVLFETHVKGVTQRHPELNEAEQGRYLGLVSPAMLNFYREQHITTVQLLPVAACMHEPHLLNMGKVNYWGYNPYLFMAPDPRYADVDAVNELKTAVRELHRHGIEVILDVVYNHTAEGGEGSTVFNLKGLDGRYYIKHSGHFANYTGCGNTVDLRYQPALNLVMDTLRYWVTEYQIDGFRFDLAATLGREGENFNPGAAFFKALAQDPILKTIKLIAEPWDIGPNGYQVGNFPFGWNECNDKLRDISRSFWRGDTGYLKEFATRLMGSRDIYSAAYWPFKMTVNYITYHDGFTLQDLVSYKQKHNDANGENNRDGHGDNRSANYGVEGDTADFLIRATREKQKRNFISTLLFSFGIPHILTADLLSHSQQGNNNAYCQDNDLSWLDWTPSVERDGFRRWVADMVRHRQRYMVPFIRAFSGRCRHRNRIHWRKASGAMMEHHDWNQQMALQLQIGIGKQGGQELLYLINPTDLPVSFHLPNKQKQSWKVLCNTNLRMIRHDQWKTREMSLSPMSMAILHCEHEPELTASHDAESQTA